MKKFAIRYMKACCFIVGFIAFPIWIIPVAILIGLIEFCRGLED